MSDNIPTPLASGATDHGGPNGIPPSSQSPASDAAMIAQDVANKYPNQAPAVLTSGTPQMPTLAPQGPAANAPNATSTPTSTPPTPQTPHEVHQSLYQRALSILAPPTRYLDAQGNPQQTRPSLSNSILSGAIAGLLTPTAYRQGAYGPVVDSQATAANAFAAGKQQRQEQDAAVQKHVEDVRSRKLQAIKDNADTIHLHVGVMQDAANMRGVIQTMNDTDAPLLKMAEENDKNLDSNDPNAKKAIWGRGFTMEQALRHPEWAQALTQHTLVHDGMLDVPDANGNLIPTPTYTIIDPNIKANMTKEAADIASQIYPSWKSAFEGSNGSMQARLGQLSAINNQVNSVKFAEKIFQDAADSDDKDLQSLGIKKDVKDTLMHAVRQGTPGAQQALQALMALENAKAANGTPADVLNRLINDPDTAAGRGPILNALGITAEKAQDYINKYNDRRVAAQALAHEGGIGEKAPATAEAMQAYENSRQSLPAEQRNDFLKPPEKGWTQGQLEKEQQRVDAQKHDNVVDSQAAADPVAVAQLTNLTIGAGDLTAGKELFTGNRAVKGRIAYDLASAQLASSIGLNPIHYTAAAMQAKQNKFNEYTSTKNGSIGSNLNSYQTFLLHNADAIDASNEWRRSNAEFWNTPLNELEKKFGNDPSYIKFKASLIAPDKEFMSFLNGGHAETMEDAKAISDLTNVNMSPSRIFAAMQQLAKTADDRAATLGDQYVGVVGTTYPNLLNPTSQAILKTLGIKSRAAAFTGELPRNPAFVVNPSEGTLKPITDPNMARRFLSAASNSPDRAIEIAREHGWTLRP